MLSKPLIINEKFRSERSGELVIACDITYNSIALVYYDRAMHRNYARAVMTGTEISARESPDMLARLAVTSMREFSVRAGEISQIGIAAPVHISHILESELSPTDLYLSPETDILFVPFISAGISGRFTASLLTISEDDFFAADVGKTLCLAKKSGDRLECAAFPLMGAFDGSALENGMPAEKGAVEAVRREEDGTIAYEVVGDGESKGVAPSAAVMTVGIMLDRGILDGDGIMWDRDLFYIGEDFFISQSDVRALQTDKAHIAAALDMFPEEKRGFFSGEPFSAAEGFSGMIKIGAIPQRLEKSAFCRNSAERGIILFLENEEMRDKAFTIASRATDISEMIYPQYRENYLNYLTFSERREN